MSEPTSVAAPPVEASRAHAEKHVTLRVLIATLVALLILTALTVGVTEVRWLDFGSSANLWIALLIATVKATLVALYFMHLRYDRPFNAVILIAVLMFAVLFCGLTLLDTKEYQPDVQAWRAEDETRYAPDLELPPP
jgi:cytochrome c oxidase subunit 4